MTIAQMTAAMRENKLSSAELTAQYLAAIKKSGRLNAVIEINPDAAEIAQRLDSSADKNGPLHGIPVLIKDNISTCDRMHTAAGSVALAGNIPPEDAPIVSKMRRAGAVILGKTNMTEFANYMSKKMPNGYSSRGGRTLHFFDPKSDPSGSSTGSAVAVAAGLCAAAVG
ncbi:MAG: amidase family protein, partial [Treponema sp.]|nr:amidase family protein [Treponema sp.]